MGIRISEMEEATTFGADDYVPIVTNGTNKKALGAKIKDFIAGFFVSKSGDTMSDDLTIEKRSGKFSIKTPEMTVDTSANNGLSQDSWCDFSSVDKNGFMYAWAESGATSAGATSINIGCRNKNTSGTIVTNSLQLQVNKDGSYQTTFDHPSAFRRALDIGYTLINEYTSNGQTLYHDLTNYSSIVIVAYFTNASNNTYIVGSLSCAKSDIIDKHPIVCMNDGTLRKGQLNFKTSYATTENFGNITSLKVFGVN